MSKDPMRSLGGLILLSTLASCGGGGGGSPDVTVPSVSFDQITTDAFAGQDLSNFDVQIVPSATATVPSGDTTFQGTMSAIYEADVDGNTGNQDVAMGDAEVTFAFDTGVVAGSADNFTLYSTESGCVEIPACDLIPESTLAGSLSITNGVAAESAFVADLTGSLTGTGGFTVPDQTVIGGGFGQLEGDDTLLIWGLSDFDATTNGSDERTVRILLGGAESN
ncbi:hypothetical protein [Yoonia algicola]|uniref:Uncharacterized protein n=1 Tax=Yoonia algicola TaxID=3137368 RepID=A0AAN0NF36_9RHOB